MSSDFLLVQAAKGQKTTRTPVWLMRQAGRYMSEYQDFRKRYKFMEICRNPDLAANVSLMPYEAFAPDGVVMFSDIMFPIEGMNISFALENAGPHIQEPIRTLKAAKNLQILAPHDPNIDSVQALIRILKNELAGKCPVIGFLGGPFTLATYVVEGKKSEDLEIIKTLMSSDPATLEMLLDKLAKSMTAYCLAQVSAGVDVIQIFDTWAGMLSEHDYRRWALPYQQQIFKALKGQVPTILYVRAATGYLETLKEAGADCISLDWRIEIVRARKILGENFPIQGNMDPALMLGTPEHVAAEARRIIKAGGQHGHILNLGHGLLPTTPRENVKRFIEVAKETIK